MARRRGWRREGGKGRFRYVNSHGKRISDPEKIERIEELAIPPAWREVWISPRPRAKLQATGIDRAGRCQYIYHPEFRARQEQEKFDKLVRFAERLRDLRQAMSEHMEREPFDPEWTCALAVRLINLGGSGSEPTATCARRRPLASPPCERAMYPYAEAGSTFGTGPSIESGFEPQSSMPSSLRR